MSGIAQRLSAGLPAAEARNIAVVPLKLQLAGPRTRLALWLLAGAIFCVLLIAAANVACLSLARASAREREFAVRAALGAGRARIARQLLAETFALAGTAALVGLGVAWASVRAVVYLRPAALFRLDQAGIDPRALAVALALCLLTAALVGLAPAIGAARTGLRASSGRGVAGRASAPRLRRALVLAQFALTIVLLAGAGLLLRSLWSVQNVSLGFRPERVLSMQLALPPSAAQAQRVGVYNRVLEQVQAVPGVESAAIIGDLFIGGAPAQAVTLEGGPAERLPLRRDEISDDLFRTLGVPLLRGRPFSAQDGPESPRVAIVNEALARRLLPGEDPIGRRFRLGAGPWFTVAGVVGDMRRQGLETAPPPQMFEPLAQNPSRLETLLVRTSLDDPLKLAASVRAAAVRVVGRDAPVYGVNTLESRLGGYLAARRFQSALLAAFAVAALLMAAVGIFGLIQYSVATRIREIGIRIALGAPPGQIFRMIAGEGLRLSLAGGALGLAGAVWLGRAGQSLLYGVSGADPITFASVPLLLTGVAAAACYLPARRATKVDPLAALRAD